MIEQPRVQAIKKRPRRRAFNPLDRTIGTLVFLSVACGSVAANDTAPATVRMLCAAIGLGCAAVVARLFPTGRQG